jgi:hypothetical protein
MCFLASSVATLSHLTSCTPTKCNLYFGSSLDIVTSEADDTLNMPISVMCYRIRGIFRRV